MCGGTDATQDTKAPKTISSEEMILFDATSALNKGQVSPDNRNRESLGYVSAFAASAGEGCFLFLETGECFNRLSEKTASWALVKEDIFPSLVKLVKECILAKDNGFHSETHGLPENFGGSVSIEYASGEKISFSNNQQPILSPNTGLCIKELFSEAMKGEIVSLPDVSDLCEIRFSENRKNGGFTEATLTLKPDVTGENAKKSKYDGPEVYKSVKKR